MKIRPYIETKLQFFLHALYRGKRFSKIFCAILTKINGISIFVSIPNCPMDYCIATYSTVLLNKTTSLGEERANLSAFRTFGRFVLVWICRFPLPLGVWEGL